MSFDGVVTRAIIHECQPIITGGRIQKIYQPESRDLTLLIRANRTNYFLLLSAHPTFPRIQLTDSKKSNPKEPPRFCMLMRKYCEGGQIDAIRQVGMERIVHIDIVSRNELNDRVKYRIVFEIMGKHSNIIFVNLESGKILDSIIHVGYSISRVRQVLPGHPYKMQPTHEKKNPLEVDKESFIAGFDYNGGKLDQQILQRFTGIGPPLAKEIVHRAGIGRREQLWEAFDSLMRRINNHQYQPSMVQQGTKRIFAAFPLTYLKEDGKSFPTMIQCINEVVQYQMETNHRQQKTSNFIRLVEAELKKNKKKLKKLEEDFQQIQRAEDFRIKGELLTAHLHKVKKGDRAIEVVNFFHPDSPPICISLDPAKTPMENANQYFKKYRKYKNANQWNLEQKEETLLEIEYLQSILVQLQDPTDQELEQIKEELESSGLLKANHRRNQKKRPLKPKPFELLSSDRTPIFVGKNNKQNDYLTHSFAKPNDLWLHTQKIPGSHVVIKGSTISDQTLYEGAMLAAYFSQARSSSQVPVDYTLVKYVKKPSGARPGYVIYENQKTLYVTPDPKTIEEILNRPNPTNHPSEHE